MLTWKSKVMKKEIKNQLRKGLTFFSLSVFLLVGSCFEIKYIIQPDAVEPNSSFNVKLCVQISDFNRSDPESCHGVFGILLPEGWAVKDSIEYSLDLEDPYVRMEGVYCYNDTIVSFLDTCFGECPSGYYWWAAKSSGEVTLILRDSAYINITVLTDSKRGEFKTKYIVGDDSQNDKLKSNDPVGIVDESDFIAIQVVATDVKNTWQNEAWEVYPNPSHGELFLQQNDLSGDVTMHIYDLNGKLQKSAVLWESLTRVDLNSLSKGTYLVALEKHGKMKTQKLIIL